MPNLIDKINIKINRISSRTMRYFKGVFIKNKKKKFKINKKERLNPKYKISTKVFKLDSRSQNNTNNFTQKKPSFLSNFLNYFNIFGNNANNSGNSSSIYSDNKNTGFDIGNNKSKKHNKISKYNKINKNNKAKEKRKTEILTEQEKKQTYLFTQKLDSSGFETDRKPDTKFQKFYKTLGNNIYENSSIKTVYKVSVGIFLLILSFIIIFFSSVFSLKEEKIIIERLDDGSNIGLISDSIKPYIGTSIFRINSTKLKEDIIKDQKNINQVIVTKLPLNGIRIKVASYKAIFKTRFKNRNPSEYLLLENGVLIRNSTDSSDIPVLDITSSELNRSVFLDYEQAIDEDNLLNIYLIYLELNKIIPEGLSVSKMHLFQIENEVHVTLSNNTILFFDLSISINRQFDFLKQLNKTVNFITVEPNGIVYINFGIIPSVAVCDNSIDCYNNLVNIYGDDYK